MWCHHTVSSTPPWGSFDETAQNDHDQMGGRNSRVMNGGQSNSRSNHSKPEVGRQFDSMTCDPVNLWTCSGIMTSLRLASWAARNRLLVMRYIVIVALWGVDVVRTIRKQRDQRWQQGVMY